MSAPTVAIYWEGERPPAYLTLCVTSWLKYIPIENLVILNQSNVEEYLSDYLSAEDLRQLTYAKQSDVVSACYLAKFGGCFIDADTVFTSERCLDFIQPDAAGKLKLFSYHIGALSAKPGNPALEHWAREATMLIKNLHIGEIWSSVGNSIIDPFLAKPENKELVERLPVLENVVTPERMAEFWVNFSEGLSRQEYYREFWFNPQSPKPNFPQLVGEAGAGIVCLHNSWTPRTVWDMTKEELGASDLPIAKFITAFADPDMFEQVEAAFVLGTHFQSTHEGVTHG